MDISQAMLMQMAWRVREWTVSAGSFSFNGVDPFTTQTWFMGGGWNEFIIKMKRKGPTWDDDGLYRDVTDEQDILGPSNESFISPTPHTLLNAGVFGGITNSGGTYRQPADNFPGEPAIFGGVSANLLGGIILFNPTTQKFLVSGQYVSGFFINTPSTPRTEVSFFLSEDGDAGSFTLADSAGAPGFTCGLGISGVHTPNSINEGIGGVGDLTMTATRWWPYKNSAGLPVYDEATGAQLRDPFS